MTTRTRRMFLVVAALTTVGCQDASLSGSRMARAQAATSDSVITRRIWSGPEVDGEGSPSPDGKFLTFADWRPGENGNLAVRDIATGEIRVVAKAGGAHGAMSFTSILSPDGRRVIYIWSDYDDSDYSLRIIDVDGSGGRTLMPIPPDGDLQYVEPHSWSPDGGTALVVLTYKDRTNRIALLSVADGTLQTLKSLDWRAPKGMAYSPDGRFIAYDLPRHQDSPQRDILLLASDGSREHVVVDHPADDRLLGWASDGKSVIFSSDRGTSPGAWTIGVADGRGTAAPRLVKSDMWRVGRALGTDRNGALYYSVQPTTRTAYTATLDPVSGNVILLPSAVGEGLERTMAPAWSPDGQLLAHVTQSTGFPASGPGNFRIVITSLATGQRRELVPKLNAILAQGLFWFPDGQSLLVSGANDKGRYGLYRVDAQTGAVVDSYFRPVDKGLFGAILAPDGKSVYYRTFTGDKDQISQIMRRDLENDEERELFRFHGTMGWASPSPDGSQLAFSLRPPSGETSIYVMPAAGGPPREVARLAEDLSSNPGNGPIVWDATGHLIFVTRAIGTNTTGISRVPLGGGPVQKLDVSVTNVTGLRLHPDGRRLAFQGGENSLEIWVMEPPRPSQ